MEPGPETTSPPIYTAISVGPLPRLAPVRQRFDTSALADVPAAVAAELEPYAPTTIRPGMRVAITAGSRGIANIRAILATIVQRVSQLGGQPFIIAAMGSHGGATPDGQRAVLTSYAITEATMGCPVVTSLETVCLGHTPAGVPVYIDQAAYHADAIILVNRVKPHSILTGNQGSGLLKMAALGLGKARGAQAIHAHGLAEHLLPVAHLVLDWAPVAFGIAIIENAYDQTAKIVAVPTAEIEATDPQLQAEARALLPMIPFDPLDVLIVEQIGKNFSGTGMDPNVIGMHRRIGGPAERQIRRIVALDLSPESHGNAHGIGMADVITEQLRAKIDWHATYTNALTADFLGSPKLPITCASARDAVALALQPFDPDQARVVRVRDTAHLEDLWVSPALLAEVPNLPGIEQRGPLADLVFD